MEPADAMLDGRAVDVVPGDEGTLAELAARAVTVAARDLGLDPRLFAEELAQGEIGLMIHYLAEAAGHVDDLDLRMRIESLLHRLTAWTEDAG
jgi:hypothetical protein